MGPLPRLIQPPPLALTTSTQARHPLILCPHSYPLMWSYTTSVDPDTAHSIPNHAVQTPPQLQQAAQNPLEPNWYLSAAPPGSRVSEGRDSASTRATKLRAVGVALPRRTLFEGIPYVIAKVIEPAVFRKLVV